jgi:hypothetical protein
MVVTSVIPALRRLRQEDQELQAILDYTGGPVLKFFKNEQKSLHLDWPPATQQPLSSFLLKCDPSLLHVLHCHLL